MSNIKRKRPCEARFGKQTRKALFHEFGQDCNEDGTYSVAIIEYENGRLDTCLIQDLKFTDR